MDTEPAVPVLMKLLKNGWLVPCTDDLTTTCDEWCYRVARPDLVTKAQHLQYRDLIGGEPKMNRYANMHIKLKSRLYWINLRRIRFKHSEVYDTSNTQYSTPYTVVNNALALKATPDLFVRFMRAPDFRRKTVCLPLMCFMMNGMLYTHDHRRVVSCLLAGVHWCLGFLNQNPPVIKRRHPGYDAPRCCYSRRDQSCLLSLDPKRFGNHFVHIGPEDDWTHIMRSAINNEGTNVKCKDLRAAEPDQTAVSPAVPRVDHDLP